MPRRYVDVWAFHDILRPHAYDNPVALCTEKDHGRSYVAKKSIALGPASSRARVDVSTKGINLAAELQASAHSSTANPGVSLQAEYSETLSFRLNPLSEAFRPCTCRAVVQLSGGVVVPPRSRVVTGSASISVTARVEQELGTSPPEKKYERLGIQASEKLEWNPTLQIPSSDALPATLFFIGGGNTYSFRLRVQKAQASVVKGYSEDGESGSGLIWLGSSLAFDAHDPNRPGNKEERSEPRTGAGLMGFQVLDPDGNVLAVPPGVLTIESASGTDYPILGPVISGFCGQDDFEDNLRDRYNWGTGTGAAILEETGARVNYVSSSLAAQSAEWPWMFSEGLGTEDWELRLSVHAADLPNGTDGDRATVGLAVGHGSEEASVRMEVRRTATGLQRDYVAVLAGASPEGAFRVPASGVDGAVKLSFSGHDRTLKFWHDGDGATGGYQWTVFHTVAVGSPGWNPAASARFRAKVFGQSAGVSVTDGMFYADDFSAASSPALTPDILTVEVDADHLVLAGLAEEGTVVKLEVSADMNEWALIDELTVTELESFQFRPSMVVGPFFRLRY